MSGVLVAGSANIDLSLKGPRLPRPGETVMGDSFVQSQGGKGANQAVAAARAGGRVSFIAATGADGFGDAALAHYAAEGINLEYAIRSAEHPTGVALILVDASGANMIAVHPGANAALTAEHIAAIPDAYLLRHRVLAVQLETPLPAVRAALRRARRLGLRTVLTPAPAIEGFPSAEDCALIDVIVPNETEARIAAGLPPGSGEREASRALLERGCGAAVVTLGERGCLVAVRRPEGGIEISAVPAPRVEAVDTVAAGDAFTGALAIRLAESPPEATLAEMLIPAARWAAAAAALSVTRRGAQDSLPRRGEIEGFLERLNR